MAPERWRRVEELFEAARTMPAGERESFLDQQGAVQQSNFHDYQVLRIPQAREVEVHIVPSTLPPEGIGELGVPPAGQHDFRRQGQATTTSAGQNRLKSPKH